MHLALPYPAAMLDMSVWVCLPCYVLCVGSHADKQPDINLSINIAVGIKQAF